MSHIIYKRKIFTANLQSAAGYRHLSLVLMHVAVHIFMHNVCMDSESLNASVCVHFELSQSLLKAENLCWQTLSASWLNMFKMVHPWHDTSVYKAGELWNNNKKDALVDINRQ
jgi:hypothetical protein